jgi:hypothetical protein
MTFSFWITPTISASETSGMFLHTITDHGKPFITMIYPMPCAGTLTRESITTGTTIPDVIVILETGEGIIISGRGGVIWTETAVTGEDLLSTLREERITVTGTDLATTHRTDHTRGIGTGQHIIRLTGKIMALGEDLHTTTQDGPTMAIGTGPPTMYRPDRIKGSGTGLPIPRRTELNMVHGAGRLTIIRADPVMAT